MTYPKPLAALAVALAVPAAALSSLAGPAMPAGAAPAGEPSRLLGGDTVLTMAADTRTGRRLGELSTDGTIPGWYDLAAPSHEAAGGTTHWPSASDSLSAGPWCIYQCITKGVAYEHGDGVRLVVETSVPAEIVVLLCRDDDGDYDCEYHDYNSSVAWVTEFEWVIDPLAPGTYWVTATATDGTGTSYGFGEFTLA